MAAATSPISTPNRRRICRTILISVNRRWRVIPSGILSIWLIATASPGTKTLGQLFCDDSAQQIVDLLLAECDKGNVTLRLRSEVLSVARDESGYTLQLNGSTVQAEKLVIASGGLSMPGLGATPFGYKIAEQFGLSVFPTRAALVPFTLHKPLLEQLQMLSGVALETTIDAQDGTRFKEAMLFTHRGLSGPAVLQISSYWLPGEFVTIDLSPATPLEAFLTAQREAHLISA